MKNLDKYERQILSAYEAGKFKSTVTSKASLRRYREYARATLAKNKRVNIRLSSSDLMDIQTRAAEEGVPYQTLIASVLHKFVTGRFTEKPSRLTTRASTRQTAARDLILGRPTRARDVMPKAKHGGWKTCSRGHKYRGSGTCPVCWPRGAKKKVKKGGPDKQIKCARLG